MRVLQAIITVAAFSVFSSAYADEIVSCPHSEVRPVSFTSINAIDQAELAIIGDDCSTAELTVSISTATGKEVLRHRTSFTRLQHPGEQSLQRGGVFLVLERQWDALVRSETTASAPQWDIDKHPTASRFAASTGVATDLPRDQYERVRSLDQPLACVLITLTTQDCFYFDPGTQRSRKFLTRRK